jgi:hypothetical protein
VEKQLTEIQSAINSILSVKSLVRKKKKKQADKKKELFVAIINSIEQIITRQNLMYTDLQLDFTSYDESFLDTIDALIILHFGKEGAEVISWYLWERLNPDGSTNYLMDEVSNEIHINTVQDLWELLLRLNPKYDE